jgi:hypothetical protein
MAAQIRLNGQVLEVKNIHKILGITFDSRLTWKAYKPEAKEKAAKRMNVLRSLWPEYAASNLRNVYFVSTGVRQHIVLVSHRWTIEAAGARELRIALGAFCVCKTTNILCESGYENFTERRKRKLTKLALHIAENENHPVNKLLRDQEVYDEYALLGVDLDTVECVEELEHPPWINNISDNMII